MTHCLEKLQAADILTVEELSTRTHLDLLAIGKKVSKLDLKIEERSKKKTKIRSNIQIFEQDVKLFEKNNIKFAGLISEEWQRIRDAMQQLQRHQSTTNLARATRITPSTATLPNRGVRKSDHQTGIHADRGFFV